MAEAYENADVLRKLADEYKREAMHNIAESQKGFYDVLRYTNSKINDKVYDKINDKINDKKND